MLRSLFHRKAENGVGQESSSTDNFVSAPPVDEHFTTRYFKVVHRGRVAVRSHPAEPAPEDGQSFGFGDVIEVCGLAVAVPEGVVVELKQPQGGWVFQRHGSKTLLEEVDALRVEEGDWWYRVVHPNGAHFAKIPSLQPKAPRHLTAVPQNTVVHACRRHTPPGSSVTFVELSASKGWIVESAAEEHAVLEKSADGQFMVEHITGEYRDESEAWYRVICDAGVELLETPDAEGARMLELFLPGKTFCVSERFQPPGQKSVYLKIKGRRSWVLQAGEGDVETLCVKLPPPMDEAIEQWYRVEYPGGVRVRASPTFDHTDSSLGVLACGWVFLATRRYRAPGSSQLFLQVATPEGVVRDDSEGEFAEAHGNGEPNAEELERRAARRRCGWVPSNSNGTEVVVTETMEPWIERGLFAYQVVVDDTLSASTGPHKNAPTVLQNLPPYSVAAVTTFLETGDGQEGFVQLAGTGSWVMARRRHEAKMARLPAFPRVNTTSRRFVVSASEGVETIVGPSSAAERTGHVLPMGTEGRSEMLWSVKGWPGDRGMGDKKFVLLEGMGWVQMDDGKMGGEVQLQELGAPRARASSSDEELDGQEEQEEDEEAVEETGSLSSS